MKGAISVTSLGKAYPKYPTSWSRLAEWMFPGAKPHHVLKWVMQDVTFEVHPGEAVGIIGINGAGKSTLLKMIAGTTKPTTGRVNITGRVAALLELGMGFHPDFTGRQNVYLAGQLLGLAEEVIEALMPQIVAFAEIQEYIDQPIRVYSSGMQMRLAFSLATAQRPDILIVDEALAVGDAYFQHKSFDRIRKFCEQGTTLLIVSHDKQSIQSICHRAILLNAGRVAMEGTPEAVMDYYNALLADKQNQEISQTVHKAGKVQTTSGTGEASVEDIFMFDAKGCRLEVVDVGQPITLCVIVRAHSNIDRLVLGFGIKDRLGQVIYGTNTELTKQPIRSLKAGEKVRYEISFAANLGTGSYSVQTALTSTDTHLENNFEWKDLALIFHVVNINKSHFVGVTWMQPVIVIARK